MRKGNNCMKSTKNKLLSSIATLCVCFAMLIGSTYAWFTDTASTGVNRIQAGNLDLNVMHKSASVSAYETIESKTNLLKDKDGSEMSWEPGAMTWETFQVSNAGNLAFEWQMSFNNPEYNTTADGSYSLKDVIKVAVVDGELSSPDRATLSSLNFNMTMEDFVKSGILKNNGESSEFSVVLYWEPTANDNYWNINNGKTVTPFTYKDGTTVTDALCMETGIHVAASQYTYEKDSFGDDYDVAAFLAEASTKAVSVSSAEALKNAVAQGAYVKLANDIDASTLDLTSSGIASYIDLNGKQLTVNSLSISDTRKNATISIVNTHSTVSDVVVLTGDITLSAPNGNVIIGTSSTLNFYKDPQKTMVISAARSSLHINSGTVNVYNLNPTGATIEDKITSATFAPVTIPASTHLVVESSANFQLEKVVITKASEEQIDATSTFTADIQNSQQINVDLHTDAVTAGNVTVVDESSGSGGLVSSSSSVSVGKWVAQIKDTKYTSIADALEAAVDNDTVKLIADVDLNGSGGSEQINCLKDITIDLNGHTINGSLWSGSYLSTADGTATRLIDSVGTGKIYSKFHFGEYGAMMQANAATAWQHGITIDSGTYLSNNVAVVCQVQNINDPVGLIINGGTIGGTDDLIEGASLPGPVGGCVEVVIGTANINGGTFKAAQYGSVIICESGSSRVDSIVNIYGGDFKGACMFDFGTDHSSKSIINVYGGDFTVVNPDGSTEISATSFAYDNVTHAALVNNDMFELNIMGGTFNYDPSAYVNTAIYNVTQSGSTWTVTAK